MRSPTRTSTHAPIAFAFSPRSPTLSSIQLPIARAREVSPEPTFRQRLQPVVGLAREIDLGIAVAVEVVARDPHSVHLKIHPAVVRRVERRRRTCRNAPELLLAVGWQVVLLVVAHAKIHPAGPAPVA